MVYELDCDIAAPRYRGISPSQHSSQYEDRVLKPVSNHRALARVPVLEMVQVNGVLQMAEANAQLRAENAELQQAVLSGMHLLMQQEQELQRLRP